MIEVPDMPPRTATAGTRITRKPADKATDFLYRQEKLLPYPPVSV